MKSYPLKSISIEAAKKKQFELVDAITHEFSGLAFLSQGDLGVVSGYNQPTYTRKVESVLARFFKSEDAVLVRGAGTSAIREALSCLLEPMDAVLVHTSPIYETTKVTFKQLGIRVICADFHDEAAIKTALASNPSIKVALIQYSRQTLTDRYDIETVIKWIKKYKDVSILTDDNYAVMKVDMIGAECGAEVSAFSLFKLLGPPGIGCVVGKKSVVEAIRKSHYSGGMQVQGYEAMDALRSLVYAPVSLAIQADVVETVSSRLNLGEVKGVKQAYVVNAQSKVVIVELEQKVAKQVIIEAEKRGAAPHPVGAESRFEIAPMFYRVSKTMCDSFEDAEDLLIRINPMRSGSDTVIRILKDALNQVMACS